MKMTAVAIVLALASISFAQGEVSYRRYNGDIYGSDGTRIHKFGGDTYIRRPGSSREIKCHEFAGKTTCR